MVLSIYVLILILLEVTQIVTRGGKPVLFTTRLNPYSTGSNSNDYKTTAVILTYVLILILLEVTQIIYRKQRRTAHLLRLNPYSTGSNSN